MYLRVGLYTYCPLVKLRGTLLKVRRVEAVQPRHSTSNARFDESSRQPQLIESFRLSLQGGAPGLPSSVGKLQPRSPPSTVLPAKWVTSAAKAARQRILLGLLERPAASLLCCSDATRRREEEVRAAQGDPAAAAAAADCLLLSVLA